MYQTIEHALKAARESNEGRYFNCMIAMVFSAFCLEAYFNHLGDLIVKDWGKNERNYTPDEKLELLTFTLGIQIDKGRRPYQTMKEIFHFRDGIAHAKTQSLNNETIQIVNENPYLPQTEWEEKIKLNNAKKYLKDTKDIIYQLQHSAGINRDPFVIVSSARSGSRLDETKKITRNDH